MKKFVLACCFFVLMISVAYAHPPSDIDVNYDSRTGKLDLYIKHKVRDANKHYIKKIVIKRNGQEVNLEEFKGQENAEGQTLTYIISKPDETDVIVVQAYCNIFGSRKKEIK